MTCIIGYLDKEQNKVYIAGDSAASNGEAHEIRRDTKVFKNGDFIFGCTSSYRMIQLLMYSFIPPIIIGGDIHKYMCTDFINSIRKCFIEGGYLQKNIEGDEKGGTFLVGYENRLFKIEEDFQVGEIASEFTAVGCGYAIALGALQISKDSNLNTNEKLIKALEAVTIHSEGVLPPYIIIST